MVLKAGQKVWFIDHTWNELREGTLLSIKDQSSYDEIPTLFVEGPKGAYGGKQRILTDWVFATEEKGKAGLKKKIRQDIQHKRNEIKQLERKL